VRVGCSMGKGLSQSLFPILPAWEEALYPSLSSALAHAAGLKSKALHC
jgi:hypothetical protein